MAILDELGPYKLNQIITVFAGPVYWNIEGYEWLAETATRMLKPNKSVLCYVYNRTLGRMFAYKLQFAM